MSAGGMSKPDRDVRAVSTRSATGEGVRLGRPGLGRQVLLEDLARGAVAEAAPRRVVEPVGQPPQADARERFGLAVAGEETPDPPVRVLDGAFLPGGVRVAEVGLHREVAVERGVAGELRPAVEGDGPAGGLRQRLEGLADARDHRRRALVLVRQQEGEAAGALDERGHVRLAGLLAEDQQVALPVAEGLARPDLRRPVLDPALARDRGAARPAAVTGPAPAARLGQVAVEVIPPAFRPVDVAVDGLVADRRPAVRLLLEPAGYLLRRPAGLQALGDVRAQALVGGQLAPPLPAPSRQVLRVQREVAAEAAVAVAEAVPAEFAVDGGRVAAEPPGDLADRGAGLDEPEQGASLVQVEVAVGPGQGRLRRASPRKGWGFALRDRTHLVGWAGLPRSPGHAFHDRPRAVPVAAGFDRLAEEACAACCASERGRPSPPPGRHVRTRPVGSFEGTGSERGLERRRADSLSPPEFLRLRPHQPGTAH